MNNLTVYFLLPLSLLIGLSVASQAGVNAQLRQALSNPVQAAFISFLIGTIVLGIIAFFQGDAWFTAGSLATIPWWAWLGGILGAFNIAMSVFLAPKLGAMILAVSVVCGQLLASMVLDHHGWLGYPKIDISAQRLLGSVLVIIGLLLVAKQ